MTLQERTLQTGDIKTLRSLNAKTRPSSDRTEKETYTHKEVLKYFTIEPFTLEEALEALEISEVEFQEQLHSHGFCAKEDFDRSSEFSVEWIDALDTGQWKLYKV